MPDCDEYKEFLHIPLDYYEIKQNRPLRLKKKLYEFYTAPITKFWANAVSIFYSLTIADSNYYTSCIIPKNKLEFWFKS